VMTTLVISTVVVALIALFGNDETNISSDSPQTISGAASVMGALPATQTLIPTKMADAFNVPAKARRVSGSRNSLPISYEIRRDDANEEERRERDEDERDEDDEDIEKQAERARKEKKKRLERRRKEAEKLAERRREAEERGEPKPRLIGIYTEKN
jgi:hypothetical protein